MSRAPITTRGRAPPDRSRQLDYDPTARCGTPIALTTTLPKDGGGSRQRHRERLARATEPACHQSAWRRKYSLRPNRARTSTARAWYGFVVAGVPREAYRPARRSARGINLVQRYERVASSMETTVRPSVIRRRAYSVRAATSAVVASALVLASPLNLASFDGVPALHATPTPVVERGVITVTGTGFPVGGRVRFAIDGTSNQLPTSLVESAGHFVADISLPPRVSAGQHVLSATVDVKRGRPVTVVIALSVVPAVSITPSSSAPPAAVPTPSPSADPSAAVSPITSPSPPPWTASPQVEPSATPAPSSASGQDEVTPTVAATPSSAPADYRFGLIGNDRLNLDTERAAGIELRLFSMSWRKYQPDRGTIDAAYVQRKRAELAELRAAGYDVILSLGIHDAPGWIHSQYPNSRYRNQYGAAYVGEAMDSGDLNLVFNSDLRALADRYIARIFDDFGSDFWAVRLGGGRYGELTYPPAEWGETPNAYWAFDARAQAQAPDPGWRPGDASPTGEAERFVNWYLNSLTEYQTWQIATVRAHYGGLLMVLYPSWGIRPGQLDRAIAANLNGSTSAELNGEVQRGYDFNRQVAAISDAHVVVTTTWLNADATADSGADARYWSPVKYLASLAAAHPLRLRTFGENTGWDDRADMDRAAAQMERHKLLGLLWFREDQLYSGSYATFVDYVEVIRAYDGGCCS